MQLFIGLVIVHHDAINATKTTQRGLYDLSVNTTRGSVTIHQGHHTGIKNIVVALHKVQGSTCILQCYVVIKWVVVAANTAGPRHVPCA